MLPSFEKDVISIGEVLIDFIGSGSIVDTETFKKCLGGAPANFIIGCSRLGLKTGFISRIGNDEFGQFLLDTLKKESVDTSQIEIDSEHRTALAFVSHRRDREFLFYRARCADSFLSRFNPSYVKISRYLYFGSVSLATKTSRRTVLKTVKAAKKNGVKVCFDPNLRLDLWKEKARKWILDAVKISDIFLPSKEELNFITGKKNLRQNIKWIRKRKGFTGIKLGKAGSLLIRGDEIERIPAFRVRVVDTTGAGDAWDAGFIYGLIKNFDLKNVGRIANLCGAMSVSKKGAISAFPTERDILKVMKKLHHQK